MWESLIFSVKEGITINDSGEIIYMVKKEQTWNYSVYSDVTWFHQVDKLWSIIYNSPKKVDMVSRGRNIWDINKLELQRGILRRLLSAIETGTGLIREDEKDSVEIIKNFQECIGVRWDDVAWDKLQEINFFNGFWQYINWEIKKLEGELKILKLEQTSLRECDSELELGEGTSDGAWEYTDPKIVDENRSKIRLVKSDTRVI